MFTVILIIAIVILLVIPTLKDRNFHIRKLLIIPFVFMWLLYDSIHQQFHITADSTWIITESLIAGTLIGAAMRLKTKVVADHQKKLIFLKGSYFGVVLFSLIFIAHFFAGYMQGVYPQAVTSGNLENLVLMVLCTASALSVGQSGMLYYKYLSAKPNTRLTKET